MSNYVNPNNMQLTIKGNATKDATAFTTQKGNPGAGFQVAVDLPAGNGKKKTGFVPVSVFGKDGDSAKVFAAMQVKTGDFVCVRGATTLPEKIIGTDGKEYIEFRIIVTDENIESYVARAPKRERLVANDHLAPEQE